MLIITEVKDLEYAGLVLKDYLNNSNNEGVKYNDVVYHDYEQLKIAIFGGK